MDFVSNKVLFPAASDGRSHCSNPEHCDNFWESLRKIVKLLTSEDFRKRGNYFIKTIHVIENLNIPSPFKDWDEGQHTVKEFRKKHQKTNREMGWLFAVTVVINMLMVVPLLIAGNVLSKNSIK